jgi:hypothetical protein
MKHRHVVKVSYAFAFVDVVASPAFVLISKATSKNT